MGKSRRGDEDFADTFWTEIERAIDNLAKSGKLFNQPGRRDSMPMIGGPESFNNFQSELSRALLCKSSS